MRRGHRSWEGRRQSSAPDERSSQRLLVAPNPLLPVALTHDYALANLMRVGEKLIHTNRATKLSGLPEEKLFAYGWSPDGKQFAFTRGAEALDVVLMRNFK